MTDCPVSLYAGEVEVFRAPPRFSTFDWARENLRVVSGPYKGKLWNPNVAPYAQGIMDTFDLPWVRKVFLLGPSQSTKTTIAYACMFASLSRKLASWGVSMPDETGVQRIFSEKLIPYVRQNKALSQLLAPSRYAISATEIRFRDGSGIYGLWAGSESRASSISLQGMVIDEEDAYQDKLAVRHLEERVDAYVEMGLSKLIRVCKPRGTEEASTIWTDAKAQASVLYNWHPCCPSCSEHVRMDDRAIRAFENGAPCDQRDPAEILRLKLARHVCPSCGYPWSDQARNAASRDGQWVGDREVERPVTVAFQIRSWESVLVSQSKVLADWFEAQGNPVKMQRYDNNHKAVPYKVVTRETKESLVRKLIDHELPPAEVPPDAWALVCGVDTQLVGYWFTVQAWAPDMRSWFIDWGWLADDEALERQLFETVYPVQGESGAMMPIWRAGIDIGGGEDKETGVSMTEQVKAWLQRNRYRGPVFGTKGASRKQEVSLRASSMGHAAGVGSRYQHMAGRLPLYIIDTDHHKSLVHYRLNPKAKQRATLPMDDKTRDVELLIKHLTSERKEVRDGKERWIATGANHLFDCAVICSALVDPLWTPSFQLLRGPVRNVKKSKARRNNPVAGQSSGGWINDNENWL